MDQQRCVRYDGRRVRAVPSGAWHGYDGNGRILPVCVQSFHRNAVHRMGAVVFDYSLAVVPCFRRPCNRSRKSVDTAWQKCVIRLPDRICQADFPIDAENRNSAVYGTHGHSNDGGGLYLCRNRAGASKRVDQSYRHHLGGRTVVARHTGNCVGLELFQAAA